ncbi:MAG TPA: ABC-2 family transporter protein [Bacillota bacterium]|nr:ABC-2 family transporter protein [Bacillota bacterium]
MTRPFDYVRVFISDCQIKLARAMEFRFDFIAGSIMAFIGSFINILFQFFIYSKTKGFPGWSFDQVLLFQSVVLLVTGIRDTIFGNVRPFFEGGVQFGGVDRILLFPFSSLGMVLVKGFQHSSFPFILSGLLTLVYSLNRLKISLQWWQVGLLLLFIVIGLILYLAFTIFHCALALRFIYVERLREVFDRIVNFSCYPAEIFSGLAKIIYLAIIPIAVFSYYPSQVLLGRLNVICILGASISLVLFWGSIMFWNIQLKKYSGTGG